MNTVKLRLKHHDVTYMAEARVWCREKFGMPSWFRETTPRGQRIYPLICAVRWKYSGNGLFEFSYEQDAVQFAMRWA
jgi:hypothetical protein